MKHRLDVSYDYSCLLYGVSCQAALPTLCWHMNTGLDLNLAFEGLHELKSRGTNRSYAYAFYEDEMSKARWFVIENELDKGSLLPEMKRFDYIIKVEDHHHVDADKILQKLRSLTPVLMCHEADIETISWKDALWIE
jgi:hypothetical protein